MLNLLLLSLLNIAVVLSAPQRDLQATCYMQPDPGSSQPVTGVVSLSQPCPDDDLHIHISLNGFDPIKPDNSNSVHGFHIHEFGDISGGCSSTGGHYNPTGVNHGAPTDKIRHAGDFGNRPQTQDGRMEVTFTDPVATLYGEYSAIGRALVVHAGVDDLGKGGNPSSLANGNAGSRLACCVIGISN